MSAPPILMPLLHLCTDLFHVRFIACSEVFQRLLTCRVMHAFDTENFTLISMSDTSSVTGTHQPGIYGCHN